MTEISKPFVNTPVADWIRQLQQATSADDRLRALQAIGLLGVKEETAQWAAHALHDADSSVRALAAKQLGTTTATLTPDAESQLATLLSDEDPDVRFESARTILKKETPNQTQAVSLLLSFLDEDETQPLMVAAIINQLVGTKALDQIAETELLPRLKRRLNDERGEVREAVATALARWPSLCPSIMDQVLPLLDDSEPLVREKIAEAIGHAGIANDVIRQALSTAAQDEDSEVARVATESLQRLGK